METNRIKNTASAYAFVVSGRACFTLVSVATGTRFTYRVVAPYNKNTRRPDFDTDARFVQVLVGPDNTSDYTYLGLVRPSNRHFSLTAGSKVSADAPSYKAFAWFWAKLTSGRTELPDNLKLLHSGSCGRCGKELTVDTSIELGLGPICASK